MAALATTVVVGIFCPPAGMALGVALGGYEMLNAAAGKDLLSGRELGTGERWFRFGTGALGVFGGVKGLTSFSKNISMVKGASSTKMEHVVKMMQNSGRSNYKNIMTQAKNLQTAQALLNEKASRAKGTKLKRTPAELDDLARDPSHGGNITKGSELERDIGLALEERGDLGHIVRDKVADGGAEFIDTVTGKKYDVKSFVSYPNGHTSPKKGAFTVDRAMKNIMKELDRGHDLIINTTNLTSEHRAMLINELKNKGLIDKIIFYP